jgi:transcription termination factor Rho
MPVLARDALEASPLADLHLIAAELGLDGFRRLRKADLIDAILARQGGAEAAPAAPSGEDDAAGDEETGGEEELAGEEEPDREDREDREDEAPSRRRRSRRGGRGRSRTSSGSAAASADEDPEVGADVEVEEEEPAAAMPAEKPAERAVEGTLELLANGSGFVRISPPEPSEDDVYVSAAQVRRCELVSGDEVAGPVRPPRRSERYPSLVRVETINGRPADEVAEGTRFDELPVAYPTERFKLGSDDPTLKAIEFLTPFGRGSRVVITGAARAGKTEALRRLAGALAGQEEFDVSVTLVGVRPEEIADWEAGPAEVGGAVSLAASPDAQAAAVERAVEHGKRIAARGGHAVVLVDTLDGLPTSVARRALAAARNIRDGGSLTVVATAAAPLGGESTVIALDAALTSTGRFPALDLPAGGTIRPELLVGEAGAEAIASARAEALG